MLLLGWVDPSFWMLFYPGSAENHARDKQQHGGNESDVDSSSRFMFVAFRNCQIDHLPSASCCVQVLHLRCFISAS